MAEQPLPVLISADDAFSARRRRYALNRHYYEGDHDILRARNQVTPTPRNLTALFIDTTVDFMGRPALTWGEDAPGPDLDAYLSRVLDDNHAELLDYDLELATAIDGDGALKVTWDVDQHRVRLVRVDAATLYQQFNPADPDDVLLQAQQYAVGAADLPIALPSGASAPASRNGTVTEAWTRDRWDLWLDQDLIQSEPNPYGGLLPYITWPNTRTPGDLWGSGDGERIKGKQDLLNEKASDHDKMMRIASSIVVLEGVADAPDAIGGADYAVRPGSVWELPQDAKAYILDLLGNNAADQRLKDIAALRELMHQIARVPVAALGDTGRELSGLALGIEIAPLLRLVQRKRLTRTAAHRQRALAIAKLAALFDGQPDPGDLRPQVTWSDPLPEDRAAEIKNATDILALGASRAYALSSVGIADPDAELAARLQEDRKLTPEEAPTP